MPGLILNSALGHPHFFRFDAPVLGKMREGFSMAVREWRMGFLERWRRSVGIGCLP